MINTKEYTVREIAELLSTNEDTVRRWIREGKLKSTITSKKAGHRISEENLTEFKQLYPKLLGGAAMTTSALSSATVGLGVLGALLPGVGMTLTSLAAVGAATAAGIKAAKREQQNSEGEQHINISQETVDADQLLEFLNAEITRIENANQETQKLIDTYQKQIKVLESQIATNKNQIETYRKQIEITKDLKGA